MEKPTNWRNGPRNIYSDDFKLQMVELASQPGANVSQIARENSVGSNLIFKWLRLWQQEGRISRRLPATVTPSSNPTLLPVEVISELPTPDISGDKTRYSRTTSPTAVSAPSCCIEFRSGKMTLENISPELLTVMLRELTGGARG
ncbi:transposase [Acerihabitans sp. TG2]|uniref:transposase n=1 Tax=Acerihabitans sp. TG2 TaxID=3096008 RepID=UPI002B221AD7|nr:transposase [Acerihabitans sp. TG2]MEA9393631.1 transposase [Acerihabitans sp. TG2]